MSDEALEKADKEATAIKARIDELKLEIITTGYALAKTGDDQHFHRLSRQREILDLLEFAEKQRPPGYGYMKAVLGGY